MARSTRLVILITTLMGSVTPPSVCYILSDESNIPFWSTSNGYKKRIILYYISTFFDHSKINLIQFTYNVMFAHYTLLLQYFS